MQDGMTNLLRLVETRVLLNASKQWELSRSSGRGEALECDQSE